MLLFEDRKDAAKQLAKRLEEEWLKRDFAITSKVQEEEQELQKYGNNIIVLAIPRGGVVLPLPCFCLASLQNEKII